MGPVWRVGAMSPPRRTRPHRPRLPRHLTPTECKYLIPIINTSLLILDSLDGEASHPASPSDPSPHSITEQPKPLIPKLDFSSLAPQPPTSCESPTVPPPVHPVTIPTSENESQPEGDLTVVNTPRTSPDCEEAKNR